MKIKKLDLFIYFLFIFSIMLLHLRVNISDSSPKGIYFVNYYSKKYKIGDYIIYKLPKEYNKYSSSGLENLDTIKQIYGKQGDFVEIKNNKVYLNSKYIENIYLNIPIKNKSIKIKKDEYFTMSKNKLSLDSRYYGVINKENIKYKAYLLKELNF